MVIVTGPAKIKSKKLPIFRLCSIVTYELRICNNKIKITITTAEFNGLSSEIF